MSSIVLRFAVTRRCLTQKLTSALTSSYRCTQQNDRRYFSADAAAVTKSTKRDGSGESQHNIDVQKLKDQFDAEIKAGGVVPVHKRALLFGNKIAVKDETGEYSYNQIYGATRKLAEQISKVCGEFD